MMPTFNRIFWFDFETYSECDLRKSGVYPYAEHPSTEALLLGYAFDDEPVKVWDCTKDPMPAEVDEAFRDPHTQLIAWNVAFDAAITDITLRYHLPETRYWDAMVLAYTIGLPGALGDCGVIAGLSEEEAKMPIGKKLIKKFSMPQPKNHKVRRHTRETAPLEWEQFVIYGGQDVEAMRKIVKRLPNFNYRDNELEFWYLDQRINRRGMPIDIELVDACLHLLADEAEVLKERVLEVTNYAVDSTKSRPKALAWIKEQGFEMKGYTKADVEKALNNEDISPEVREFLEIRQAEGKTSTSKFVKLKDMLCADGTVKGTTQFYGAARTGRSSGRGAQIQNLTKTSFDVDTLTQAIKLGPEFVRMLYPSAMAVVSGAVRPSFYAPDGKTMVVSDFSSIEARVLSWLAGEHSKLKAIRDNDAGIGAGLYEIAAGQIYNVSPSEITKHDPRRQIGKVSELACLGADTEVLTLNGWKFITDVTRDDLVFDGGEFVAQDGCIFKGYRETVVVNGVVATPDHLFLVDEEAESWVTADDLSQSSQVLMSAIGLVSSLLKGYAGVPWEVQEESFANAHAGGQATWTPTICERVNPRGATLAQRKSRCGQESVQEAPEASMSDTGVGYLTGWPQRYQGAISRLTGRTSTTERGEYLYSENGGKTVASFFSMPSRLTDGILRVLKSTALMLMGITSRETYVLSHVPSNSVISGTTGLCITKGNAIASRISMHGSAQNMRTQGWWQGNSDEANRPKASLTSRLTKRGVNTKQLSLSGLLTQVLACPLSSFGGDTAHVTQNAPRSRPRLGEASLPNESSQNKATAVYDLLNCGPRSRFVVRGMHGPMIAHNCGYGGGVGAYASMAIANGIDLAPLLPGLMSNSTSDEIDKAISHIDWFAEKNKTKFKELGRDAALASALIKNKWRNKNPNIVKFWYDLEDAARAAIKAQGEVFPVGMIAFKHDGKFLRMRLPSGRYLCYPMARINGEGKIVFNGVDQYTRKWSELGIYGGLCCIAEGTRVLTFTGWKPIENVHGRDLVWDGIEWVTCDGAVFKGHKEVMEVAGVGMTPDHKVLTTNGWVEANACDGFYRAESGVPHGLMPDGSIREGSSMGTEVFMRESEADVCLRHSEVYGAKCHDLLRVPVPGGRQKDKGHSWYDESPCLRGLEVHVRQVQAAVASGLEKLWRAWDHGMRALAGVVHEFLGGYGRHVPTGTGAGSQGQRPGVLTGELSLGNQEGELPEQAYIYKGERKDHSADFRRDRHRSDDSAVPSWSRLACRVTDGETGRKKCVYDLINCGPRNRFVVRDENGEHLIVHNCENATQAVARDLLWGALMNADKAGFEIIGHVHDEVITLAPENDSILNENLLTQCMEDIPEWATGCPVVAATETWRSYRK